MELLKGQKVDITKSHKIQNVSMEFGWTKLKSELSIDAACFVLSDRGRCEQDGDFIFYGNPLARNGSLTHRSLQSDDKESIKASLEKLPADASKIAFTVTIHDGEKLGHFMKDVTGLYVRIMNDDNGEELFRFNYGNDLSKETAIVVGELYKYNSEWKFNAIGSGFNGGLEALCTNFGLEIEETVDEEVAVEAEKIVLSSIDLRKKMVQITLEKKKLTGVVARVGIVLDITGSMQTLYKNGTVQEVVERILAVACKFDDNATLDVWVYDNFYSRLPSVTEKEIGDYVHNHILNNKEIHKFGRNNEPPVMEDVIRKYTVEEDSETPVFIIFINDGGVVKPIKKVIADSSILPIFWQFVGIGQSDFEVLKKLDTMEGRVVDNANFFHIDDIAAVSDESLYDELLNEFPLWLKAAKEKRILRV